MTRSIPWVLLAALALAGCAPSGAPDAIPTPTAVEATPPAPTPSATPTPTQPPATRPTLNELVLTTAGFAELPLGSNPASFNPETSIVEFATIACSPTTTASGWQAVESDPDANFSAFGVSVSNDGLLRAIQVQSQLISTDRGIAVGSTREEVLAAYPGIRVAASNDRVDVYVVEAKSSWMRMSVDRNADADANGFPLPGQDTVFEMTASVTGNRYFLPSFHAIGLGQACL